MVTAAETYARAKATLAEAGVEDPAFDANILFTQATGKNHLLCDELDETTHAAFETLVKKRAERVPLQYIAGSWPFMGFDLQVGPGVLIPRPETETLCHTAASLVLQIPSPVILDLCTGTGAVGLGIQSLLPTANVTCVEAFSSAFSYLEKNMAALSCGAPFENCIPEPVQADIFEYHKTLAPASVDLIAANPPYVTESEYNLLAPELFCEPKEALVAAEDGLIFYRFISEHYRFCLKENGFLAFEIGANHKEPVEHILNSTNYANIEFHMDDFGICRVVTATKLDSNKPKEHA